MAVGSAFQYIVTCGASFGRENVMQRDRVIHKSRISHLLGSYVSRQMLALWLLELALSFGLAYLLLGSGRPFGEPPVVNHAAILALNTAWQYATIGFAGSIVLVRSGGSR